MEIELARADRVYAHYRTHQQSVARARAMYALLAWRHRPRVHYVGAARRQLEQIVRTPSETPMLIAVNHVSERDPLVLAAAGFLSPLRARIGHMRVLAKDELFADAEQRAKIDALGGIPVFRPSDHDVRAAVAAAHQLFEVCGERMSRGDAIAIFPEGTCNTGDPARLQKMSSGVGHIAVRARNLGVATPVLVTIGLAYPQQTGSRRHSRPVVVIGEPLRLDAERAPSAAAVTRLVTERLQEVVTDAHEHVTGR
ncbi:lysophospholipid acyltransferase family protein [Williamsia sp. SKLECPSW1]